MKYGAFLIIALSAYALAQTPLEFGIVQDLVGGEPRISVYSIKTVSSQGETTMQLAARAGISFQCTRHSMLADTVTPEAVMIQGQVSYSASIYNDAVQRLFSVIRSRMRTHGSGGISRFQIDLITPDEMGWISVSVPLTRVDSLLDGSLDPMAFWAITPVREVEVGTLGFPVVNQSPLPEIHGAPLPPHTVQTVVQENNCAWKSLVFPGWGQACAGEGLPIVNILIEAGGVALLFTDDYMEAGIGILAANHLISFTDLL